MPQANSFVNNPGTQYEGQIFTLFASRHSKEKKG
jgi:hypothetical protein